VCGHGPDPLTVPWHRACIRGNAAADRAGYCRLVPCSGPAAGSEVVFALGRLVIVLVLTGHRVLQSDAIAGRAGSCRWACSSRRGAGFSALARFISSSRLGHVPGCTLRPARTIVVGPHRVFLFSSWREKAVREKKELPTEVGPPAYARPSPPLDPGWGASLGCAKA